MSNSKPVVTPTNRQFNLSITQTLCTEIERSYMNRILYANIVGSLMYIMVCTRPNIAYRVSLVRRYMANPGKVHLKDMKRIMRYIKGSLTMALVYGRGMSDGEA